MVPDGLEPAYVAPGERLRFRGRIAGWGTAAGTRLVVGRWDASPFGAFADVMVEHSDGHRVLLAPYAAVAEFVSSTYLFDEVCVVPVEVAAEPVDRCGSRWTVRAGPLAADLGLGRRTVAGWALGVVPRRVSEAPAFTAVTDPIARVVLRGVRTRGSASTGRAERYGASDVHAIATAPTSWNGLDLGELRPVTPSVRFGFGSTPRSPGVTRLVTTVVGPRG